MSKTIRGRLLLHLHTHSISLSAIHNRNADNPFPIGRISLERIARGKDVSEKIRVKLTDYLNDFKNTGQPTK